MKHIQSAIKVVLLDTQEMKRLGNDKDLEQTAWLFVLVAGVSVFIGQFTVTRMFLFPPNWWVFIYYAAVIMAEILLFQLFICLAGTIMKKPVAWHKVFIPLSFGAIIVWTLIVPYITIIALWYIVIGVYMTRSLYNVSMEQSLLIAGGAAVATYIVIWLSSMVLHFPEIYWYF